MAIGLPGNTIRINCRAILFDMDGTLLDSSGAARRAWQWWTTQHGIPLEPILAVENGRPDREVIRQFASHLNIDLEAARLLTFEENDREDLVPVTGAIDITAAAQEGLWTIVTSSNRSLAEIRLRACGLPIPEVFITADMISRGKPDPECYLLAARALKVQPHECVVFEDSPAGISAARAAGMPVVGVLTTSKRSDLSTSFHISDFRDVAISHRDRVFEVCLNLACEGRSVP